MTRRAHPARILALACWAATLPAWSQPAAPGSAAGAPSPAPAGPRLPTLFLIGDSTVNNSTKGQMGWGKALPAHFDTKRLAIVNAARGGRSSRTFFTEKLWAAVAADLQPGDFVLIQFGHNDGGSLRQNATRASLKGAGEETQEITDPKTAEKVTVHTYGWYLRQYVRGAKAQGAMPIILSQVPRNLWKDGKVGRVADGYGKWAAEVARAEGVPFVDLNAIVADRYDREGEKQVGSTYFDPADHTHTLPAGAKVNAACVAEGLRALKACPLAGFLRPVASP